MSTPKHGIGPNGWQKCRGPCQGTMHASAFPWCKRGERCQYLCYQCKNAEERARRAAKKAGTFVRKGGPKTAWTPERIQALRECIEANMFLNEISAKMGCPEQTLIQARYDHSLPRFTRRPSSRPRKVKCIARVERRGRKGERRSLIPDLHKLLRVERLSVSGAAERLGVSKGVVSGVVDRYGEEINAYRTGVQRNRSGDTVGARAEPRADAAGACPAP